MINIRKILRRVGRVALKSLILSLEKKKLQRKKDKTLKKIVRHTKKLQKQTKKQDYKALSVIQTTLLKFRQGILKEKEKIFKDTLDITNRELSLSNQQEQFSERKKKLKKREGYVLRDLGRISILSKLIAREVQKRGKGLRKRELFLLRKLREAFRKENALTRREEFTLEIVWFFFLLVVGLLIYIKINALSTDSMVAEQIKTMEEQIKKSEGQTRVIKDLFKMIGEQEIIIKMQKNNIDDISSFDLDLLVNQITNLIN